MKTLVVILLMCSATSGATAYPEPSRDLPTQGRYSLHQVRGMKNVASRLLPRMSRPERQPPVSKKPSTTTTKSSKNQSSSSRGLPPDRPSLERSSSKRKESTPLANPPSQRPRIAGPSTISNGTPSKPARNPLGKPPLHPSFKSSPAYAFKMAKLSASKAQREKLQRNWHTLISDTSFLSEEPKSLTNFPDSGQIHSPSPPPPPFRSQAITPSSGRMISVH